MESTRLSSKGQIVIPKRFRERHGWGQGTEFTVEEVPSGILLRPQRLFAPTRLEDGLGCAGYKGPAKSLEEIEEALGADLRERLARESRA